MINSALKKRAFSLPGTGALGTLPSGDRAVWKLVREIACPIRFGMVVPIKLIWIVVSRRGAANEQGAMQAADDRQVAEASDR